MQIEIFPIAEADVVTLMKSINRVVINPVIFFLFAVAMVYFLFGVTRYFLSPDNTEVRDASKAQMIWGVVGLFVMVAVFGILQVILNTFGISNIQIQGNGNYTISPASGTSTPTYSVQSTSGTTTYNLNGNAATPNSTTVQQAFNPSTAYTSPVNGNPSISPLKGSYVPTSLCWGEAVHANSLNLSQASVSAQNIARKDYLSATGQTDQQASSALPTVAEQQTIYDSPSQNYYVWLGVVAPIGRGQPSDCNALSSPPPPQTQTQNSAPTH